MSSCIDVGLLADDASVTSYSSSVASANTADGVECLPPSPQLTPLDESTVSQRGTKRRRTRYEPRSRVRGDVTVAGACAMYCDGVKAAVATAKRATLQDEESVGAGGGGGGGGDAERARAASRRLRNRRSAAVSRKRKREYTKNLEAQVRSLNEANSMLYAKLVQIQAERNWFEHKYKATQGVQDGGGAAAGGGHPFNHLPSAAAAAAAALSIFQAALQQHEHVVDGEEQDHLTAQMNAVAPAPPTAPSSSNNNNNKTSSTVDAVTAALSPVLPSGFTRVTTNTQPCSPTLPTTQVATTPALPTPLCLNGDDDATAAVRHSRHCADSRDVVMSCSESQPCTYSREPTVFASFIIATLALLPGMACMFGIPAHPSHTNSAMNVGVTSPVVTTSPFKCHQLATAVPLLHQMQLVMVT